MVYFLSEFIGILYYLFKVVFEAWILIKCDIWFIDIFFIVLELLRFKFLKSFYRGLKLIIMLKS